MRYMQHAVHGEKRVGCAVEELEVGVLAVLALHRGRLPTERERDRKRERRIGRERERGIKRERERGT